MGRLKNKKVLVFLILVVFVKNLFFVSKTKADWVETWLDSAVIQGPSSVEGATRHYYSLGGAYLRWKTGDLRPFSVTPPRISLGCGGIDVFWGSFSVMDFDYAVERLKQIISAAAPFAFFYALGTLCEKCKQIASTLDNAANFLNQISIDTCQSGRAIAAYLVKGESPKEHLGNLYATLHTVHTHAESYWDFVKSFKNWTGSTGNVVEAAPPKDVYQEADDSCPDPFKNLFSGNGRYSLLKILAKDGVFFSEFENLIRGFVGDVVIDAWNGKITAEHILPCMQKVSDKDLIKAFLNNDTFICTSTDVLTQKKCSCNDQNKATEGIKIKNYVKEKLEAYVEDLESKTQPDPAIDNFMKTLMQYSWMFPVYGIIKQAYLLDIPLNSLVHEDSILVECAASIYAKALLENILAAAGYMQMAKNKLIEVCREAANNTAEKGLKGCILCEESIRNSIENEINKFVIFANQMYQRYSKAFEEGVKNTCQQVIVISQNMQQLERASAKWAFSWTMLNQ